MIGERQATIVGPLSTVTTRTRVAIGVAKLHDAASTCRQARRKHALATHTHLDDQQTNSLVDARKKRTGRVTGCGSHVFQFMDHIQASLADGSLVRKKARTFDGIADPTVFAASHG
jgi:hypothetical protein